MIRLLVLCSLGCWLLSGACAFGNIGDTYATSCQRYGPGHVDGDVDNGRGKAAWSTGPFPIFEDFSKGRCEAIFYTKRRDANNRIKSFTELELTNFLAANAYQGQIWKERQSPVARWFFTTDDKHFATLFIEPESGNACLLVATADWRNEQHNTQNQ